MTALRAMLQELNALLNEWDPIGVVEDLRERGLPLDEYESYAPGILRMLEQGARDDEIAAHMQFLVSEWMGLSTTAESQLPMARAITAWYRTRSAGN